MGPVMIILRQSGRRAQQGVTLMLSILILLVLTFAGIGLLDFVRYDDSIASNAAVRSAALQASDAGLERANVDLSGLSNFPEFLNMSPYAWWHVPPAVNGRVVPQDPQLTISNFWKTCNPQSCGFVQVPFAGQELNVEFVVEPAGVGSQGSLNGTPSLRYMIYDVFVHVTEVNPLSAAASARNPLVVMVEATLRKIQGT